MNFSPPLVTGAKSLKCSEVIPETLGLVGLMPLGALYPSKSGLMNKHIVKPQSTDPKHIVNRPAAWVNDLFFGCPVPETYRETYRLSPG